MNKKTSYIIIFSLLVVLTVGIIFTDYVKQLGTILADASVPNPGHSLSEIEGGQDLATKTYVNDALSGISGSNWTVSGSNIYRSSGNVGIGTTSPTQKLEVNGNIVASAYYYTSDIRKKENVTNIENSLSKILQLQGISYNLKDEENKRMGFSAQDLQKVYPELVKEGSDGYLSIDGTGLIAPLVEAIKEQQKKIEELEEKINILMQKQ